MFAIVLHGFFPHLLGYYLPVFRERTATDVSESFAKALRLNDDIAYELAAPDLWPRIDKWMETHQVQDCIKVPDEQFTGGGFDGRHTELFYCYVEAGEYEFDIYNIRIEKIGDTYYVISWGEIIERITE